MRTIKDNLEEATQLLKSDIVQDRIQACQLVYLDLSNIEGFDNDVKTVFTLYIDYLIGRHCSIKKVGLWNKIKGYFKSVVFAIKIKLTISICDKKNFGDGDLLIKTLIHQIRKAI